MRHAPAPDKLTQHTIAVAMPLSEDQKALLQSEPDVEGGTEVGADEGRLSRSDSYTDLFASSLSEAPRAVDLLRTEMKKKGNVSINAAPLGHSFLTPCTRAPVWAGIDIDLAPSKPVERMSDKELDMYEKFVDQIQAGLDRVIAFLESEKKAASEAKKSLDISGASGSDAKISVAIV